MATPAKGRVSGIPTPGRGTGIPTPGRARASSSAGHYSSAVPEDDEYIARSFQEAIRANDPANHRTSTMSASISNPGAAVSSLSPQEPGVTFPVGRPRSSLSRPASAASSSSAISSSLSRSTASSKPKQLAGPRPSSRASDVFRSSSRISRGKYDIGDSVRIPSYDLEGIIRYIGPIEGKSGIYAGVELHAGYTGKGKNNGTVKG